MTNLEDTMHAKIASHQLSGAYSILICGQIAQINSAMVNYFRKKK